MPALLPISKLFSRVRFSVLVALLCPVTLPAAVQLASPFGDHMVLQQGRPVPVWGTAAPGEKVTVEFAGQKRSVPAGPDGIWRIDLKRLKVSAESRQFIVSGSQTPAPLVLNDVLVGEVWLCSGQSNMELKLGSLPGQKSVVNWEPAVAAANLPLLRQFYVPLRTAATPQSVTAGAWTVCTPATAPEFSAVGFFFAQDLLRARGVPVGLMQSAYGGTPAEAWTSREGLAGFPELIEALASSQQAAVDPERAHREYLGKLNAWFRTNDPGSDATAWSVPGHDTSNWETMNLPALWEEAGHPDWDGVAWFHKTFDLPAGWAGQDLHLRLCAIDDADTTWVNGVEVGSTSDWAKARTYQVPAAVLKATGNVIAVRVLDTGGGGGIWEKTQPFDLILAHGPGAPLSLAGSWRVRFSASLADVPRPPQDASTSGAGAPTGLYNAMIAPLVPYAIRGAIFYQGESNAARAKQYRTLLPALIADWRKAWGQGDFPFLFVQIAPYKDQPPEIREAQLLAWQATKNTAMAVTIDVGDASDIHPANKQPVGARLALAARALAYGDNLEYSGPVFQSFAVAEGRAVLHFTHLAGGLVAPGGTLTGFTIAGTDGVFHPAEAAIKGDTVEVSSAAVAQPVTVRYGWANVASGNLFNSAGLPASPFRTDIAP